MSPETPQPGICDAAEEWPLIQEAIGDLLRRSVEEVTQEPLPSAVCLLLVRLAFAEVMRGTEFEECETVMVEADLIAEGLTV